MAVSRRISLELDEDLVVDLEALAGRLVVGRALLIAHILRQGVDNYQNPLDELDPPAWINPPARVIEILGNDGPGTAWRHGCRCGIIPGQPILECPLHPAIDRPSADDAPPHGIPRPAKFAIPDLWPLP